MANAVLVDSSFFIQRFRERRDPLLELRDRADEWDIATCGLVWVETCRGFKQPAVRRRYDDAFALMLFAPTDAAVWEQAAQLGWELDRAGKRIPAPDLVVAASALAIDASVCAFDVHFHHVPGLRVISPLD